MGAQAHLSATAKCLHLLTGAGHAPGHDHRNRPAPGPARLARHFPPPHRHAAAVLGAVTGILINRLGTLVEPFLALYLVAVRGFPVAAAGGVLAVYALGSMISEITGGLLADTLGRRATLTAGMLANGACLIALGYVTAAPAVIAMTFAAGATTDTYRPAAQALVADLIPAAGRARAYGLISWAANLGFSAAMLSGGVLARAGFRWLFWADALTCAAFAALAWRDRKSTRLNSSHVRISYAVFCLKKKK